MRPIDADALKTEMETAWMYAVDMYVACDVIDKAETLDVKPAIKGKWLDTKEQVYTAKNIDTDEDIEISIVSARCSVCNLYAEEVNNFPPYMHYKKCPHCGAEMY